ncbi:MAG: hypothetical protein ACOCP8_00235 [archaeon]
MKKFYYICYWIYLKLIRPLSSPLLYWIFRKTIYRGSLPNKWEQIKKYNKYDFENAINKSYKWDYKYGIIDFSLQEPNFYFVEKRKYFRDCDDTSRMWYLWAKYNRYKVWEICLWNGFKKAHFITIFKNNNKYILCNYKIKGKFNSIEEAIKSISGYDDYLIYQRSL